MDTVGEECLPLWPEIEKRLEMVPEGWWPYNPEEYGARLRKRREYCGLSMEELGRVVGCTPQNIRKIEEGTTKKVGEKYVTHWNTKIKKEYVPAFARKLDCSCSYLLGYTDKPTGIWNDPKAALYYPVISYRQDEILAIATIIQAYNRDPDLFFCCVEMLKEPSPERRGIYKKKIRAALEKGDSKRLGKMHKERLV